MNIQKIWENLESGPGIKGTGYQVRRIASEGVRDLFLGIERPSENRIFLMMVHPNSVPETVDLPSFRGFDVGLDRAPNALAPGSHTLQLRLLDRSFSEMFDLLIADIVDCSNTVLEEPASVLTVLERIRYWQRFVERREVEGLAPEEQRGLYGELWFVREVLCSIIGITEAINAWKGPLKANQDFQYRGFATEAKTSIAKQPQSIRIASERQLDGTGIRSLVLFHLSLDARNGSGESLPDIVQSIREIARESGSPLLLEERLYEAGYSDDHVHRYSSTGYSVRQAAYFEVESDFPRIVEANLRSGVGDVHYSIAISECMHWRIGTDRLRFLVKGD